MAAVAALQSSESLDEEQAAGEVENGHQESRDPDSEQAAVEAANGEQEIREPDSAQAAGEVENGDQESRDPIPEADEDVQQDTAIVSEEGAVTVSREPGEQATGATTDIQRDGDQGGTEEESLQDGTEENTQPSPDHETNEEEDRRPAGTRHRNEDDTDPRWRKRKKHAFIVSSAGKPIFTRYGDEEKLNPLFGVMCSLVSFVQDQDDSPRVIFAGKHKIVFLVRGAVYLVMVSRTMEPTSHLARQLQFLYTQLVSILTRKGLEQVFKRRHGFDLRNLLGSSGEQVLSSLAGAMDADKHCASLPVHSSLSFVLGAPSCVRLPVLVRNEVNKALLAVRNPHLIYALLLARGQLVQFVRPRKSPLWAEDLLLLINFVNSSSSFRESDGTWTPVCLPLFSPDANVFAYIAFFHKHNAPDVCLLLLTSSTEEFFALSESKDRVAASLSASGALAAIQAAADRPPFNMSEVYDSPLAVGRDILHFVYFSSAMNQFVAPAFAAPYNHPRAARRLLRQYQEVHEWVHKHNRGQRVVLMGGEKETILAWLDRSLQLYVALAPLTPRAAALAACNRLLRWVKKEEPSLFITPQMW